MEFTAPLARGFLYLGTTLAIGRGTLTLLDRDGGDTPRAVRAALWTGALALILAPLALLLQQQQALELAAADLPGLLRDTTWGRGWTWLAMACLPAGVALPWRASRAAAWALRLSALGVAVAMGGLGHAAADEQWPLVSRVLDAAHVAGMGAWIGALTLLVLSGVGDGGATAAATAGVWRAFSRTATVVAPIVVLSGVGSAWRRVGASGPAALLASEYGQLLLLKMALVSVVLAVGYTQRQRLGAGGVPVRRVVQREVILAAVVLAVTAWMTGMDPPGE
ncbi:MAG: CopD family protein [Gemmatimonadota bacterium]|nr:CopD family protein [Gemmatimonadota bacterium]